MTTVPRFVAVLTLMIATRISAAPVSGEKPHVLPEVKVNANVPIVKAAEFRLREPRYGAAAVVADGMIYLIGGANQGNIAMDSIDRFDPRTGVSTLFARLHTGRYFHRAVVANGKIYVLGGITDQMSQRGLPGLPGGNSDSTGRLLPSTHGLLGQPDPSAPTTQGDLVPDASVETIDLATGAVARGSDMPLARAHFGCVVANQKIYAIGGRFQHNGKVGITNSVDIFELASGQWTKGVAAPAAAETAAVLVDGGFIVTPGGFTGTRSLDTVTFFDPREGVWRGLPKLSRPTSAASVLFLGHYLFLFGGSYQQREIMAYDLKTRTTEAFALDYRPSHDSTAVVVDGKAYVMGGASNDANSASDNGSALDWVQVFALAPKAMEQAPHS